MERTLAPGTIFDMVRCYRCRFFDRLDFFVESYKRSSGKGACRKCGFTEYETTNHATEGERELVRSGYYDEFKEL